MYHRNVSLSVLWPHYQHCVW